MKNYKAWTTLDVKFLQVGFFPQGRSPRACRVFCKRNGIPFAGKREFDENERLVKRIEEKFNQPERHNMAKNETYMEIPVTKIRENPNNPRTSIDSVEDLKASIKANGLLQPIAVRPLDDGTYEVIAGNRRYRACREIGMKAVPCTVREADDATAYTLATAENIVRENMNAVDEANAVSKLFAQGKSRTEIAAMFGKSARWAEGRRRIAELGGKAMEYLAAGKINLGHAEVLTMCRPEDVERWLSSATWKTPEDLKHDIMNAKPLLDRAPFDPKKVCKNCENRSDKQLDLFGDVQCSYCLDKECYLKNVKKEAKHWRNKFLKEGLEEVPEDELWSAQNEYDGYVNTSSGEDDEDDDKFIKECIAKGMKPMFWVDDDTAEWGHVFRRDRDEDGNEDYEEENVDKDSWSYQINHMGYERALKVRNEASAEEKRIVADRLKGVFGNISRTAKAFILEILNCTYTDEDGKEETYLKHQHDAEDDFLDGVADAITDLYDGVNPDIREFLEMESRKEFERTANDRIPEDEENDLEN